MPRLILIDLFRLSFLAPPGLPDSASVAAGRTLDTTRFQADLRRAAREVVRRYPALSRVRLRLTR